MFGFGKTKKQEDAIRAQLSQNKFAVEFEKTIAHFEIKPTTTAGKSAEFNDIQAAAQFILVGQASHFWWHTNLIGVVLHRFFRVQGDLKAVSQTGRVAGRQRRQQHQRHGKPQSREMSENAIPPERHRGSAARPLDRLTGRADSPHLICVILCVCGAGSTAGTGDRRSMRPGSPGIGDIRSC